MPVVFYIAAVIGAIAVYLTLPHRRALPRFGGVVAAIALVGFAVHLVQHFAAEAPGVYFYLFAAIAAACAVKVITHTRPVYSALYFVLVVLSSAGLLVLLEAEFMAFAMVIIYGGAILVTYMFVIMLATLPQTADQPETSPIYDREAREPVLAVLIGFALLGVVGGVLLAPASADGVALANQPPKERPADLRRTAAILQKRFDVSEKVRRVQLESILRQPIGDDADPLMGPDEALAGVQVESHRVTLDIRPRGDDGLAAIGARGRSVALTDAQLAALIYNIDNIGVNLFEGHTLGIELAGVILLLSMVGAIVIARRQVPEAKLGGYEVAPS